MGLGGVKLESKGKFKDVFMTCPATSIQFRVYSRYLLISVITPPHQHTLKNDNMGFILSVITLKRNFREVFGRAYSKDRGCVVYKLRINLNFQQITDSGNIHI